MNPVPVRERLGKSLADEASNKRKATPATSKRVQKTPYSNGIDSIADAHMKRYRTLSV